MNRVYKTNQGTELPLLNLRGKEYLEVKYRLVWFREEHPQWSIETNFLNLTEKSACARAAIRDETGRIIATSHKFENERGFPDFMEKAETGAIGRALALIGYGTQFCADELDEGERIVDAPVASRESIDFHENIAVRNLNRDLNNDSTDTNIERRSNGQEDSLLKPDLGEYQITFGRKYRGKKLKDVPRQELESYLSWLASDAEKKGTPLSQDACLLKKAVEMFYTEIQDQIHGDGNDFLHAS